MWLSLEEVGDDCNLPIYALIIDKWYLKKVQVKISNPGLLALLNHASFTF
jgi:hypothetical protein